MVICDKAGISDMISLVFLEHTLCCIIGQALKSAKQEEGPVGTFHY